MSGRTRKRGKCVLKNCKNALEQHSGQEEFDRNGRKVTYHRFPKNELKRQRWVNALQLNEKEVSNEWRVCSNHFLETDFDRSLSIVRLRENVTPFLAPFYFCEIPCEDDDHENGIESEANPVLAGMFNENWKIIIPEMKESTSKRSPPLTLDECKVDRLINPEKEDFMEVEIEKECDPIASKLVDRATSVSPDKDLKVKEFVDRATSVSPERVFNSPTKQRIRESFQKQLKKEKQEKNQVSRKWQRAKLKIASMEKIMNKLKEKKFLSESQLQELEEIGKFSTDSSKGQDMSITT